MKTELLKKFLYGLAFGTGLAIAVCAVPLVLIGLPELLGTGYADEDEVSPDLLEVQSAEVVETTDGAWCVRFEVLNRSERPVHQFKANADLLDASGRFLGDVTKRFEGTLAPGDVDGITITEEDRDPLGLNGTALQGVRGCRIRIDYALTHP